MVALLSPLPFSVGFGKPKIITEVRQAARMEFFHILVPVNPDRGAGYYRKTEKAVMELLQKKHISRVLMSVDYPVGKHLWDGMILREVNLVSCLWQPLLELLLSQKGEGGCYVLGKDRSRDWKVLQKMAETRKVLFIRGKDSSEISKALLRKTGIPCVCNEEIRSLPPSGIAVVNEPMDKEQILPLAWRILEPSPAYSRGGRKIEKIRYKLPDGLETLPSFDRDAQVWIALQNGKIRPGELIIMQPMGW